jgi:Type I restriction modification DNA specificity domain
VSEDRENSDFISPDQLPHGWELLPLKDLMAGDKTAIKRGPFGSAIKKSFFVSGGYKVYEQKNAIYDDATLGNYFVNPEKFAELRNFEVKPGDFIISCSGTIGRISRLPPNAQPGVINQALLKLTIDEGRVHPKYFLYLFRSHRLQQLVLKDTRGSAMKNLASVDDLKQIRLPLPPFKQQEIIVAEIEKQFSRLDEAVANLKRVKANLKRYKAAVLKSAVEGKLTEEWRKAHRDVEPGSELLKRILAERHAKWDGKGKYKEAAGADKADLPPLRDGWTWATVEQLAEIGSGNTPKGIFEALQTGGEIPWFKVGDMNRNDNRRFMLSAEGYLSRSDVENFGLRSLLSKLRFSS